MIPQGALSTARDLEQAPEGTYFLAVAVKRDCDSTNKNNTFNNKSMANLFDFKVLIFKIPYLIKYLSEAFTLLPGDVIITGTPHGVVAFRSPPIWLKAVSYTHLTLPTICSV